VDCVRGVDTLTIAFTIAGAPRTKGNSAIMVKRGRALVRLPPKQYQRWYKSAAAQALAVKMQLRLDEGVTLPIAQPVRVAAVFYRDRASGDLDNYEKGFGDFLQRCGFVANDRLITSWDGSRLDKDAARPRVEVRLEVAA
jgi:Holliday junction resolvase RusA-like endonuclease